MPTTVPDEGIPLTVTNPLDVPRTAVPITSGIPMPQGALQPSDSLCLTDGDGAAVPAQFEPLAFWPEGSVKWALLDFQADIAPHGKAVVRLTKADSAGPGTAVKVSRRGGAATINTGCLRLRVDPEAPGLIDSVEVLDAESGKWRGAASRVDALVRTAKAAFVASRSQRAISIERRGPMRGTVAIRGEHTSERGDRCFSFVLRIHAFAGLPCLKLEYMFLNDNSAGVFTRVREVALSLGFAGDRTGEVNIGGFDARDPSRPARLLQRDDVDCVLEGLGRKQKGGRAPGWVCAGTDETTVVGAVRDFWQQWPKSIEVTDDGIRFGLLPALEKGQYDGCEPVDKHYYLFRGQDYLIKTGVAKRHEVWLSFGDQVASGQLAAMANDPLMAVPPPEWFAATGAMGQMLPAGHPTAADYDRVATHNADVYRQTTEQEHQYGVLNWGDWFGERVHNWGNHEYDTAHAFHLLYARTGDVAYFHEAERAAKHQADVDILHALNEDYLNSGELGGYEFPVGVGAMYLHAFGHVGGYLPLKKAARLYPKCYTAADPRNLGHLWNEGLFETYYLTGDPWVKEAALELADYLVELADIKQFTWWFGRDPHCGRTGGWPLHALMAAYHATLKKKYLRAAKRIVELALDDQDSHCGGWIYQLYPGHCFCEEGHRHMGMAVFITGVLLAGMIEYHKVSADQRVADSIVRAVDFVIADAWDELEGKFHYTSCPASSLTVPMRILWPIAYAVCLAGRPLHIHVLRKAFGSYLAIHSEDSSGPGYGKSFASGHRSVSQILPVLAGLDDEGL